VWATWTNTMATGTGKVWEKNCIPNCAQGTIGYYPASMSLFGIKYVAPNGSLFTHMAVVYHGTGPGGHTTDNFALPLPPE
jgi:hypothetical protein